MRKIRELYTYASSKGLKETLQRIYFSYFHVVTFVLYKRKLDDGFSGITIDGEFRCVEGNQALLDREREGRNDLPREFYLDKTHSGKRFYLVYKGDELAIIYWIFKKGEYSRFFDIQDDSTFEFNYNITLPEFRGNRLMARTMNYISEEMKKKGFKRALGAVSADNTFAMKAMDRSGLREFKRVRSYFSFVRKTRI